jgi:hypothetical protein
VRFATLIPLLLCGAAFAEEPVATFREDFEHFDRKKWDDIGGPPKNVEIVDGGPSGLGKCVQITSHLTKDTGGHLYKMLDPGLDTCYLRFYVKFDKNHDYVHHFVHLAGYNPPTRYPQGGAGDKPRGDERFSTGIEPWGDWGKHPAPGVWNFYSYWGEMKQARDGKYWGNSFMPDPRVPVVRDKWTCVEVMLKCNTAPDKADGEQALWIDGKKVGRWGGIRWRTSPKLKVNGLWMLYYITPNAAKQNGVNKPRETNRVWFDEIVVSDKYVGPLEGRKPEGGKRDGGKDEPPGQRTTAPQAPQPHAP